MNVTLKDAVIEMMEIISKKILSKHKTEPVNLYITGGIAIYFHTASRVTKDLDAILDRDVDIPKRLKVI